jgi:uncharacterized membrane protein (DUF4010 family)
MVDEAFLLVLKLAVSTSIGLLIGLEREWAHKDVGVRSFAISTLLGTLSWLVSPTLAYIQIVVIAIILLLVNVYALWQEHSLQVTTSLALVATNILGMIAGTGNFLLAFAGGLVITGLLFWKTELVTFSGKLTVDEIRGTLLLGFIAAVVYPLLPNRFIDPWQIVNPRSIWLTVVIVSGLSFINYILLRVFGTRGIRSSAVLGGLVNSAATTVIMAQEIAHAPEIAIEAPINVLLACIAMMLRDGTLVVLFSLPGGLQASMHVVMVLGLMMLAAGIQALLALLRLKKPVEPALQQPLLNSPLDLREVFGFGMLFLFLTTASGLANRLFGTVGFLVIVIVGAVASAASSAVLVGQHLARVPMGDLSVVTAMFLATVVGLLENVVIFWVVTRNSRLTGRLFLFILPAIGVGALVLLTIFNGIV